MRVALVTTPAGEDSAVTEFVRHLLPHLRIHCEIELFVQIGRQGALLDGMTTNSVADLRPDRFDQVVYQVGNEMQHAFMPPIIKKIGGVIALHDWRLVELALGLRPELARGGLRGRWAALCEGGIEQSLAYSRCLRGGRLDGPEACVQNEHGARRRIRKPWEDVRVRLRTCERLALNRSVVRVGDAFLVDRIDFSDRILAERNAPIPIAVVARSEHCSWQEIAAEWSKHLASFPPPHSQRRSLIRTLVEASVHSEANHKPGD